MRLDVLWRYRTDYGSTKPRWLLRKAWELGLRTGLAWECFSRRAGITCNTWQLIGRPCGYCSGVRQREASS